MFMSEVAWACWKFTIISNKGTLFNEKTIKKFGLFLMKSIMKRFS